MDILNLGNFLLHSADEPLVFRGLINSWPACKWTPRYLDHETKPQKIRYRIGKKSNDTVQWETECCYADATIGDFIEWLDGNCCHDNPLASYHINQYWCYADYKYMAQMFVDQPHMLHAIDWGNLGFIGRHGVDSTWWMGSPGAYTVCHYDTYGCNLVAQIYGRKEWTLFAPSDSSYLYPTRIPYEESSVFSQINIKNPDFQKHPKYKLATPYKVILEPRDVLFVPHQWWHHVESLDTSISVNTWLEMEKDKRARLHESITRLLACALLPQLNDSTKEVELATVECSYSSTSTWLNPTEEATSFQKNLSYIKHCSREVLDNNHQQSSVQNEQFSAEQIPRKIDCEERSEYYDTDTEESQVKKQKMSPDKIFPNLVQNFRLESKNKPPIVSDQFEKLHIIRIPKSTNLKEIQILGTSTEGKNVDTITDKDIMNSILNPNVIEMICKTVLGNIESNATM